MTRKVEAFRSAAAAFVARYATDEAAANACLIELGIQNPDGTLTDLYASGEWRRDMADDPITELGRTTWHNDGFELGTDCGISLGLGDGRQLYVGEISKSLWSEQAVEYGAHLDLDDGWWVVLFGKGRDTVVVAKCVDKDAALVLMSTLEIVARKAAAQERTDDV